MATITFNNPTMDGSIRFDGDTTYTRFAVSAFMSFYLDSPTVYRTFIEWDISSIPVGSTITKVEFRYHGSRNWGGGGIRAMANQPSIQDDNDVGNKVIYDDAVDGTEYLEDNANFPEAGTGKNVGGAGGIPWDTDPKSEVESRLTDGWFALGLHNQPSDGGVIFSEDHGPANPPPTLYIEYDLPAEGNLHMMGANF